MIYCDVVQKLKEVIAAQLFGPIGYLDQYKTTKAPTPAPTNATNSTNALQRRQGTNTTQSTNATVQGSPTIDVISFKSVDAKFKCDWLKYNKTHSCWDSTVFSTFIKV